MAKLALFIFVSDNSTIPGDKYLIPLIIYTLVRTDATKISLAPGIKSPSSHLLARATSWSPESGNHESALALRKFQKVTSRGTVVSYMLDLRDSGTEVRPEEQERNPLANSVAREKTSAMRQRSPGPGKY